MGCSCVPDLLAVSYIHLNRRGRREGDHHPEKSADQPEHVRPSSVDLPGAYNRRPCWGGGRDPGGVSAKEATAHRGGELVR